MNALCKFYTNLPVMVSGPVCLSVIFLHSILVRYVLSAYVSTHFFPYVHQCIHCNGEIERLELEGFDGALTFDCQFDPVTLDYRVTGPSPAAIILTAKFSSS